MSNNTNIYFFIKEDLLGQEDVLVFVWYGVGD